MLTFQEHGHFEFRRRNPTNSFFTFCSFLLANPYQRPSPKVLFPTSQIYNHIDDDICGVSLSTRYSSNLVTIWNRVAPNTLPSSATTPHSGRLPFSSSPIPEDDESSPIERGVENMKEFILASLTSNMRPQSWYYRVIFLLLKAINERCIVRIAILRVKGSIRWLTDRELVTIHTKSEGSVGQRQKGNGILLIDGNFKSECDMEFTHHWRCRNPPQSPCHPLKVFEHFTSTMRLKQHINAPLSYSL